MPSWVTPVSEAVTAVASLVTAISIFILWRQVKADHERSRRTLAAEMLRFWVTELNPRFSIVRKLVETLDFEQTKRLFGRESISVKREHEAFLKTSLSSDISLDYLAGSGPIQVPEEHVAIIRWTVITFLNNLESVLVAWRHDIADRQMIEEEFRYLVAPKEGHFILETFRDVAGPENFPAISEFVTELQKGLIAKPRKRVGL